MGAAGNAADAEVNNAMMIDEEAAREGRRNCQEKEKRISGNERHDEAVCGCRCSQDGEYDGARKKEEGGQTPQTPRQSRG